MSRYNALRELLPSLYRPEDDDPSGEVLPINASAIVAINGAAPAPGSLSAPEKGFTLHAEFAAPITVTEVRFRPGRAAGSNLFLEFYRVRGGRLDSRPRVVAPVVENVATLPEPFTAAHFALRLRRPGLLGRLLKAAADMIEQGDAEATVVLQSHWFQYADFALYEPYAARFRKLSEPPAPTPHPNDPALRLNPYILDLARLAGLVSLPPWQEPPALRENVEAYRRRIRRTIDLYRNGLGTLSALRAIIEAQLPPADEVPQGDETPEARSARLERDDRPFWLEEYAPLVEKQADAYTLGAPEAIVGPLMRWTVENDGLGEAAPTLYIQGVAPVAGQIDAATNPVIELYQAAGERRRLGIAYRGTLAPDETLRLRPSHASWLAGDGELLRAESLPDLRAADPTAPGPWSRIEEDAPVGQIVAFARAADGALWAAVNADDEGSLWRCAGAGWQADLSGLPRLHCLLSEGQALFAGTDEGVYRVALFEADELQAERIGPDVPAYVLHRAHDGIIWVGSEDGAAPLGGLATPLAGTPIYAIADEPDGTLYFGGELGLFLYQPGFAHWYWYAGGERSDQAPDWHRFDGMLPAAEAVFLPPVRAIFPAPDASLWVGTDRGFARYLARAVALGMLSYTTLLEAYPDLVDAPVTQIAADERGLVWLATARGLFRYDGRDLWQHHNDRWRTLGRADRLYGDRTAPEPRGGWRFNRVIDGWQRLNPRADFETFTEGLRSAAADPVRCFTWTDGVAADLGKWDGATFTPMGVVDSDALVMRYKPDEQRILDGGIPAIPRLAVGASMWRYLSLEPEDVPEFETLPAWTVEGRLLPPPEDRDPAPPGRYDQPLPPPSHWDDAVFAYNPQARVWFAWDGRRSLTVLARLKLRTPDEAIDPAILDRVRQGIAQVRPAGVRVLLAVEEEVIGE